MTGSDVSKNFVASTLRVKHSKLFDPEDEGTSIPRNFDTTHPQVASQNTRLVLVQWQVANTLLSDFWAGEGMGSVLSACYIVTEWDMRLAHGNDMYFLLLNSDKKHVWTLINIQIAKIKSPHLRPVAFSSYSKAARTLSPSVTSIYWSD